MELTMEHIKITTLLGNALKENNLDLAVSMTRLIASQKGWCSDPQCKKCPLGVNGCMKDRSLLIEKDEKRILSNIFHTITPKPLEHVA